MGMREGTTRLLRLEIFSKPLHENPDSIGNIEKE